MQRRDSISFLSVCKTISFLSNIKISSIYLLVRDDKNIWFGSVWWKFVKHEWWKPPIQNKWVAQTFVKYDDKSFAGTCNEKHELHEEY